MKILVVLIGVLVLVLGLVPLLAEYELLLSVLAFFPGTAWVYQVISMVVGALTVWYGIKTD